MRSKTCQRGPWAAAPRPALAGRGASARPEAAWASRGCAWGSQTSALTHGSERSTTSDSDPSAGRRASRLWRRWQLVERQAIELVRNAEFLIQLMPDVDTRHRATVRRVAAILQVTRLLPVTLRDLFDLLRAKDLHDCRQPRIAAGKE